MKIERDLDALGTCLSFPVSILVNLDHIDVDKWFLVKRCSTSNVILQIFRYFGEIECDYRARQTHCC